jgi:hypothetical protein
MLVKIIVYATSRTFLFSHCFLTGFNFLTLFCKNIIEAITARISPATNAIIAYKGDTPLRIKIKKTTILKKGETKDSGINALRASLYPLKLAVISKGLPNGKC